MSENILDSDSFGEKIYNKFPLKYREDDLSQNLALKRYIKSLGEGFKVTIDDINGLLNFCDSDLIPDNVLPTVLRHYWLDIDVLEDIPPKYLRGLLKNIGVILLSRGTHNSVSYVVNSMFSATDLTNVTLNDVSGTDYTLTISTDNVNTSVIDTPQVSKGIKEIIKKFTPFFQNITYWLYNDNTQEFTLTANDYYADIINNTNLDSITFDGNHYVDLGIVPTSDFEVTIDFEGTSRKNWLFGSRTSSTTSQDAYVLGFYIGTTNYVAPEFDKFRDSVLFNLPINERHSVVLSKHGCYTDNGVQIKSPYECDDFIGIYPLFVGTLNHQGNPLPTHSFKGEVYSIIINDGNSVISYSPHTLNGVSGFIDNQSNFYPLQEITEV